MIRELNVPLPERAYPIRIGSGLLSDAAALQAAIPARQVLILSNEVVAAHYLERVTTALADRQLSVCVLPDGEIQKSWDNAGKVLAALAEMKARRDALLVALGGGVIGDLGGFCAALWMRGIGFVQLPTTLLAMVDSSVGGKTAVNLPQGKNLVGAFWQPRAVLADLDTLATLPEREYRAGLAEVVKYGAIGDVEFFEWLETHATALLARVPAVVAEAVERSCRHKAGVVLRDEREEGERALLNFGHTFGHALEAHGAYTRYLHGEAVAIGMVMAARVSAALGLAPAVDAERLARLLGGFGLPLTRPADLSHAALIDWMLLDKKNRAGELRLVLWHGLGRAFLRPVELSVLASALAESGV
ncbi:MAG: 3-dehydroquinate synthase [Xanthomonadales bacterium]|jgi:3-dehydroquinate synthase|nr:3-dehydroquinate synthase [Xanthomonadales bacterium]